MKFFTLIMLFIFSSCSLLTQKNPYGTRLVPLEDFFKNPEVSQYKLSPNGRYFAYLKPYQSRMNIYVRSTDLKSPEQRLTGQIDRDISSFFWKEDSTLIFFRDFGGNENYHLFRINIDGTNEQNLTPFPDARVRMISDLEGISETDMLISINERDKKVFDVYRINIATGELKMIEQNPGSFTRWVVDHDGKLRAAASEDGVNTSLYFREDEKQPFQKVLTTNFKDSIRPLFFTFDNKQLYVVSNRNRDKSVLTTFDPKTKREGKVLFEHPDVDIWFATYSKKRKVLSSVHYVTTKYQIDFLDPVLGEHYKSITSQLPGYEVYTTSLNKEEDKFIVRATTDRTRGAFYLYDSESQKLTMLDELSPWINSEEMAPMKPITYKSRDGLTINGYLTLPINTEAKNLPVVVNPHGGPWTRDMWGFNSEIQFLANRGYAVLQMDYRGSTGYGKKFWMASFKQWGKAMQDDITDGVQYLIDQGIANPDQVCIYGASYGGYAALAGLTFTPDLYACGVSYVGVSNIFTLLETIPPYWESGRQMLYEQIGDPEKDYELLKAASPLFHVDKIKAPLLVAQGAQDPRVKQAESDQIVEALKERGIDVPYLLKENEGHGFRNEENRFEFYQWLEKFLGQHLTTPKV
jgi:dipeptidyl aminopeptidase/acylaminoacyl peptidase